MPWLSALRAAFRLSLWRIRGRPDLGPRALVIAFALHFSLDAWLSWHAIEPPRELYWPHAITLLGAFGVLWLASLTAAKALQRPVLAWSLAGHAALALLPLHLLLRLTLAEPPETVFDWLLALSKPAALNPETRHGALWLLVAAIYGWVVLSRLSCWLARDAQRGRQLLATLWLAAGVLVGFDASRYSTFWYPKWDETPAVEFDAEAAIYAQPELLNDALSKLQAQTPGQQDVYVLAFGGDGAEKVFRNEVEFAAKRFGELFDAQKRTVQLINHPSRVQTTPLATRTNLGVVLRRLGQILDPSEDLLILFMTSHGTEDPSLYVGLDPLPLNQISPTDLKQLLDESGIRWRIAIISACYSGGFIPSLKSPDSLVITAARADRTSFGCGSGAEYTYFGRAFLIDAMQHATDWREAFEQASTTISRQEAKENLEASEPQFVLGDAIRNRLPPLRQPH